MKTAWWLLGGVMLLAGCAHEPVPGAVALDDEGQCRQAGVSTSYQAELLKRGLIEAGEREDIAAHQVRNGMSECAALAATFSKDAPYRGLKGPYHLGTDNVVVVEDADPRSWPSSSPGPEHRTVPKYLLTLKNGKVIACRAVDISKVGRTGYAEELFVYPCAKDVPGFK